MLSPLPRALDSRWFIVLTNMFIYAMAIIQHASSGVIIALYVYESLLMMLLLAVKVCMWGRAQGKGFLPTASLAIFSLVVGVLFVFVFGELLIAFATSFDPMDVQAQSISLSLFLSIFVLQLYPFFADFIGKGEYRTVTLWQIIQEPVVRPIILWAATILGLISAFVFWLIAKTYFFPFDFEQLNGFLFMFIGFKTLFDVLIHKRSHKTAVLTVGLK
jgi:hypothetical protein